MTDYKVARIDEIEELRDGRAPMRPVRFHFGLTSFGINSFSGDGQAGDRLINEHDETDDGNEELYYVATGRARFEIGGDTVDAPAGTFVAVEPQATRTAFAEEPGTTLIAIGGVPGKAYEARGWEAWAPLIPAYEAGRHEEVLEQLAPLAEAHPEYPLLTFNVACLESLTGRKEEAIAHLRSAIERDPRFRDYTQDSDLDAIRDDPRFAELVG